MAFGAWSFFAEMSDRYHPPILPWDGHNQRLVSSVHPRDWKNPIAASRYNLVVIGGGPAGLVTAAGAAGLGAKVALVERHLLGGDCLNVGCVPSKALIRAARAVASVREASEFGVIVSSADPANPRTQPHNGEGLGPEDQGVKVDFGKVMERMRRLRADLGPHDSAQRFAGLGVDVFLGEGRFTGEDCIEVEGQTLRFVKAVIATGARAAVPPIHGLSAVRYLTNETLFTLTELPKRFGVLGAGPIGCEMAQSFARFGSEVVLIEAGHGILPREDADASAVVRAAMERDGVELVCCAKDLRVSQFDDVIHVNVDSHGARRELRVDQLLVAVGRVPNIEGLGLETVGVQYDSKGVLVDDRLQTSRKRIYACGDVCSRYAFTHAADFMARLVIRNALFHGRAKASALRIPWATYTSPEIAHVGLYEKEAREQGIEVDTFKQDLRQVDRAILDGETEGFVRVHVRRGTDEIVGATVVAAHASEWMGEITLAMQGELGLGTVGATIHPYPTQTEAIRKLGDLYNRTRLTPWVQSLMRRWFAWQR